MMTAWSGSAPRIVGAGQHHVEDDQIESAGARLLQTDVAVLRAVDVVAVKHEHVDQATANGHFVFDDQDASFSLHRIRLPAAPTGGM
jgi:hypothetical protein